MWDWINSNSAGVQAIGTILAICVAIFVPWRLHKQALKRTRQQQREERLVRMESAASIAINAMNRIEKAWENVVKNPGNTMGYYMENFSRDEFEKAAAALHEINVAHLPDWEMVRPILGLRDLVVRAAVLVEGISKAEHNGNVIDEEEGRKSLGTVHDRALTHTAKIEAAVNRMRDEVK